MFLHQDGKTTFVLQYKDNGRQGTEILSALDTLELHYKQPFEVILLGESSPVLKGTKWENLPVIEGDHTEYPNLRGQHIRVAKDLMKFLDNFDKEYFVLMSDDFFSINDFTIEDLNPPLYKQEIIFGKHFYPNTTWSYAKWKTGLFCRNSLKHAYDFTTHTFAKYNSANLREIIRYASLDTDDLCVEDVYFNMDWQNPIPMENKTIHLEHLNQIELMPYYKERGILWLSINEAVGSHWEEFSTMLNKINKTK